MFYALPLQQMYDDTMQAIHDHLVQKSMANGLTYTSELIPEREGGSMCALSNLFFPDAHSPQVMAPHTKAGLPGVLLRRLAHARRHAHRLTHNARVDPATRGRVHGTRDTRLDDGRAPHRDVHGDARHENVRLSVFSLAVLRETDMLRRSSLAGCHRRSRTGAFRATTSPRWAGACVATGTSRVRGRSFIP